MSSENTTLLSSKPEDFEEVTESRFCMEEAIYGYTDYWGGWNSFNRPSRWGSGVQHDD